MVYNTIIRKICIGKEYKTNAMHYYVGQEVFDGHTIKHIVEEAEGYRIYIQKGHDVLPWKYFNKNMGIGIEFDLNYDAESL